MTPGQYFSASFFIIALVFFSYYLWVNRNPLGVWVIPTPRERCDLNISEHHTYLLDGVLAALAVVASIASIIGLFVLVISGIKGQW